MENIPNHHTSVLSTGIQRTQGPLHENTPSLFPYLNYLKLEALEVLTGLNVKQKTKSRPFFRLRYFTWYYRPFA